MSHQNSTWTIKSPHGLLPMLQSRYLTWRNLLEYLLMFISTSFTSICRPLSGGMKFMEDSITAAFTTTLLTFLKTCKRALQRNAHRIYLSGGLCKYAFYYGLKLLSTHFCLCRQVFPAASAHQQSSTAASRKAMKEQRARIWCNLIHLQEVGARSGIRLFLPTWILTRFKLLVSNDC